MIRLKYPLVVIVLVSWVIAERRFVDGLPMLSVSMLAAAYLLAMIFLVPSASNRKMANEEPAFGVGMKFLLFGPFSLAAIISVGATIVNLKQRNFCEIIDCFSLHALLRFHLPYFASEFTIVLWQFYYIVFVAVVLVQLIKMIRVSS